MRILYNNASKMGQTFKMGHIDKKGFNTTKIWFLKSFISKMYSKLKSMKIAKMAFFMKGKMALIQRRTSHRWLQVEVVRI